MSNGTIYAATNKINGKVYVGQTVCTLGYRRLKHKSDANNRKSLGYDSKFYRAIRKYGVDGFNWKILDENVKINLLDEMEKQKIREFDSLNSGYNSTSGGQKSRGSMSDEVRKKISKSKKGQAPWNKGIPMSTEAKRKMIKSKENKFKNDADFRKNMSISHGGYKFRVYKNGKLVGEWVNQSECARELGLLQPLISKCLKGQRKTHNGFKFIRI